MQSERVKRHVDKKKNQPEIPARGIMNEEHKSRSAARDKTRMRKHDYAKGREQRARDQCLNIFIGTVAQGLAPTQLGGA